MGALTIAGHYIIPGMFQPRCMSLRTTSSSAECCLYFNHTLFRGNRVTKISSYDLSAFSSLNFPPLVNGMEYLQILVQWMTISLVGIDIVVNWNDVLRQTGVRKFRAHKRSFPPLCRFSLVSTFVFFVGRYEPSRSNIASVPWNIWRNNKSFLQSSNPWGRSRDLRRRQRASTRRCNGCIEGRLRPRCRGCGNHTVCQGICFGRLRDGKNTIASWCCTRKRHDA